jgi:Na+-translocating ferredoxin:NAD+ oxidoreductase subunit E
MKSIYNGVIKENALFVLVLGLCSALAVSDTFEKAYMMGLLVMLILTVSNITISMIRKLVPDNVRIPVFILIIGTFVTIMELLIQNYVPDLYLALNIYIPLIVVNCIVLGRALAVASKKDVLESMKDGLSIGLGYLISIVLIGLLRESIGSGTITIFKTLEPIIGFRLVFNLYNGLTVLPFSIMKDASGAFITLGFLMAIFKHYTSKGRDNNVAN